MEIYKSKFKTFTNRDYKYTKDLFELTECFAINGIEGLYLFEAVIHVEKEIEIIKNIITPLDFKQVDRIEDFENILNLALDDRKIKFKHVSINSKDMFLGATTNIRTKFIIVNMSNKIADMIINKKLNQEFLDGFSIIGHELEHREQILRIKYEELRDKIFTAMAKRSKDVSDNPTVLNFQVSYLSDVREIMSYAWQIVNNFRVRGIEDYWIKKFLSSEDSMKFKLGGQVLEDYHTVFNKIKSNTALKLLYKYMYQYLDGQ